MNADGRGAQGDPSPGVGAAGRRPDKGWTIRAKIVAGTVVIVVVVVAALASILAVNAAALLDRTLRTQLSALMDQNVQLVDEILEVHAANLQLWAAEPLVHTIARDPALAAVFLPGLRDYLDESVGRVPWIHNVVVIANDRQIYSHLDTSPFAGFSANTVAPDLLTDQPKILTQEDIDGRATTLLALKRPLAEDGEIIPNTHIVLVLNLQKLQARRLDPVRAGENGFFALVADRDGTLWLPKVAAQGPEAADFAAAAQAGLLSQAGGVETGSILLDHRRIGEWPLLIAGVGAQRDLNGPVWGLVRTSALVGLVILALGVIAALYLARSLTAPLTTLTQTMRQVAGGDLRVAMPAASGTVEVDRMAEALSVFRDTAVEIEEDSLRDAAQARQILTDAIQSINEGFVLFDADERLVIANAQYRDLLYPDADIDLTPGVTFESIVRRAVELELIKDADDDAEAWVQRRLHQHRNPGRPTVQRRGGDRWVMVSERKVAGGGTVAVFTDLTDVKRGEEELRRTTARLELALSMDGVGIWDANLDTGDVWWSRQYADMMGYGPHFRPTETTWEEILHPDHAAETIETVDAFLDGPDTRARIPERLVKADGTPIWVDSMMSVQRDAEGRARVLSGLDIDVTEQRERERQLHDANQQILASVHYASRIQSAMLPSRRMLSAALPDHFLMWEPRDIVGGDFFWCHPTNHGTYIVVGDCTGHGVPGAFMTLIACGLLDRHLRGLHQPSPGALLGELHRDLQQLLGQNEADGETDDGLEAGICLLQPDGGMVFAGARFSLFAADASEAREIRGTKAGLGYRRHAADTAFADVNVEHQDGAAYYLMTDGLIDQIGGPRRLSFGKRRARELICANAAHPMAEQEAFFRAALDDYQGAEARRDDLTVLGFRPAV